MLIVNLKGREKSIGAACKFLCIDVNSLKQDYFMIFSQQPQDLQEVKIIYVLCVPTYLHKLKVAN
jgi:hypothetical protein